MTATASGNGPVRVLAVVVMALTVMAACDLPAAAPEAAPPPERAPTPSPTPMEETGGTLRLAVGEPDAIVPHDAVAPDELLIVDALFDSLTRYAHNFVPVPAAAASWSHSDDATEWTFSLREDATFHDGTPVTAHDFAFAWKLAARDGAAGFHLRDVAGYGDLVTGRAGSLSGVEALDDHTLRVRLARPVGNFPLIAAHPALAPLPEARWRADPEAFREAPVGNGPFAAAEARVAGQYLRLQRAPGWQDALGREAQLDEVLFQFMDPETAFVAFQQGRLQISPLPDGATDAAVEQFGESDDGYRGPGVLRGLTPFVYFLAFDVTRPPFDDPDVRRAVSLALDREEIVDAVPADNVVPADAMVPPVLGGRPGSCEACRHDPAEAARLLAGRELDEVAFWFNRDGGHGLVAEQVRADLGAVGLAPVVFEAPAFGDYLDALKAGEAGFFRYGWRPEHPIADDVLEPLFHSRSVGDTNFMRYAHEDVDVLLDDARASTSTARRRFALAQAEDLVVNRDQAVVPVMWYRHSVVVADEVENFRLDPMGHANLHEVTLTGP